MQTGVVEAAGTRLAWSATGAGSPHVIVHDLADDAAGWTSRLGELPGRGLAYDRRGYGASPAPEGYAATTVEEQGEDLSSLLTGLVPGAPAVLLGDGFGALVALDVAKRRPELVSALVLRDPPLFAFVPAATRALGEQRAALDAALRDGGAAAAVAVWLGPRAEPERAARAQRAVRACFADYAGLASWPVTRRELRALELPVAVATNPLAPPHVLAAADALAALLPAGSRRPACGLLEALTG